jgi:hypothetical protein
MQIRNENFGLTSIVHRRGMATYIGRDTSKLKNKGGKWKCVSPVIGVASSLHCFPPSHSTPTSVYNSIAKLDSGIDSFEQ